MHRKPIRHLFENCDRHFSVILAPRSPDFQILVSMTYISSPHPLLTGFLGFVLYLSNTVGFLSSNTFQRGHVASQLLQPIVALNFPNHVSQLPNKCLTYAHICILLTQYAALFSQRTLSCNYCLLQIILQ